MPPAAGPRPATWSAHASTTDRGVARILLFIIPVVMWLFALPLLGVNVDVRIGS